MNLSAEISILNLEPFKDYLVNMETIAGYIASKSNPTALEKRTLEAHKAFVEQLGDRSR